jgi:hypothetical protein
MRNAWLVLWIAGLGFAQALHADPPVGGGALTRDQAQPAAPRSDNLPPVGDTQALQLFARLEKAIGPAEGRANLGPTIPVRNLAGVLVELRYRGMRIGHGQAVGSQILPNQNGTADLAQAGDMALKAAMDVARLTLKDLSLQQFRDTAETQPTIRSQLTLEDALPAVTLDIQVAHSLNPVILGEDSAKTTVFERFVPGYHGLFASLREKGQAPRESWIWPGWAISRNINPELQMGLLNSQLGLSREGWGQLGRPSGPVLMTFNCIQVVQPGLVQAGKPKPAPILLERGNPLIPLGGLTREQVDRLSDSVAGHLSRRVRSKGDVVGVYYPSGNLYRPEIASLEEQAIVALALSRYCKRHAPAAGASAGGAGVASQQSLYEISFEQLMGYLETQIRLMNKDEGTPIKALVALAIMDGPGMEDKKELRDKIIAQLVAMQRPDGKWFEKVVDRSGQVQQREVPITLQAIILSAVSRYYQLVKDKELEPGLAATYGRLVLSLELKNPATGILPWLGESRVRMEGVVDPNVLRGLDERLSQVADRLREMQLLAAADDGPTDVVGGLSLRDRSLGGMPDPDWQTAQALHFLATGVDNKQIVSEASRARMMLTCSLAARFLSVLAFQGASTYYMQSPEDAIGGIRLVMWNNQLSPGPTAVGLLGILAYQDALDKVPAATAPASK